MKLKIVAIILMAGLIAGDVWASKKDVLADTMMGEGISGGFGDFRINAKDAFTKDSKEVIWFAGFKGFMTAYQANLRAEWITPAGENFKTEKFTTRYGNNRFGWAKLDIQGADKQALLLEGEWTVKIFWDDEHIDTKKFYLGERKFSVAAQPVLDKPSDLAGTADGHMRLAKVYFAKKDTDRAIQELMQAQKLSAESPDSYLVLGSVFNSINKPDEAILQFTKAQTLKADEAAVHRGLGIAYIKLGLLEEAVKEFEGVLKFQPDSQEDNAKVKELKQVVATKAAALANPLKKIADDVGSLEVSADKAKAAPGESITLSYNLYLKQGATYKGFQKQMEVQDQIINILMLETSNKILVQAAEKNGPFMAEKSYFFMDYKWDDAKKMIQVKRIKPDSPCKNLLDVGDHIQAVDGEEITGSEQYQRIIQSRPLSQETIFSIKRGEKDMEVKVVPMRSFSELTILNQNEYIGFGIFGKFIPEQGVRVIRRDAESLLMEGDIIKQIEDVQILSANDWRKIRNSATESKEYQFKINRASKEMTLPVTARKEKVAAVAEQLPMTISSFSVKEVVLDKAKQVKTTIERIKISFTKTGTYVIDPGSILLYSDADPGSDIILSEKAIEVTVI